MEDAERIVEVEWEDSSLSHGWRGMDELPQRPARCVTRGLVEQDDDAGMLLLFQEAHYGDGERGFCCSSFIPRSAIRKVTELRRGKR